jgi:adenylate cyclase
LTETKADAGTPAPAEEIKIRVRFPLGIKLVVIVTVILLGAMLAITTLIDAMISAELGRIAGENNFTLNSRAASDAEDRLYQVRAGALVFLDTVNAAGKGSYLAAQAENSFFERRQDIAAVIVPGETELINRLFFKNNEADPGAVSVWLSRETDAVNRASGGEPVLRNASPALGVPLAALFYPWQETGLKQSVVVLFSLDGLAEVFGSGVNSTMMINGTGDVLVHPDINMVLAGANMGEDPLVEALLKSGGENLRLLYGSGDNRFFGAGHRLSFAGAAVLSFIEYNLVTRSIAAATRRNILLSVTVMFLAIFITWFFSRTITTPIKRLMNAAEKIEQGEFSLDLKTKAWDEMGILTQRFVHMGRGLSEWEEVKNLVGRFNNQQITARARRGELALAGEYRQAVILYVDIISFPEIYRNGEPGETLTLLNRYLAKMAASVEKTGGAVDRITGSGMYAFWGLPVSSGDPAEDVMNAIRSALMMRAALWELNSNHGNGNSPLMRIGCGIHCGMVIAGRFGPPKMLEYSVIGDAVEEALMTQALNVSNRTDVIITEAVLTLAGDRIIAEELPPPAAGDGVKSAGVFGLVNLKAVKAREKQRWPFTLDDVRESVGTGVPQQEEVEAGMPDGE